MGNDDLVLALERLLAQLERKRSRSPVEAQLKSTLAHARSITAVGFARLGADERARTLVRSAFAELVPKDAVHLALMAVWTARVDMAIAGRSRFATLPEAIVAQHAALDQVAAYKVGRVWEAVWAAEPGFQRFDAIGVMSRHAGNQWRVSPLVFARDAPPDVLAARIADHLESSTELEREPGFRRIADCLEGLADLPEAAAMPILARAVELVDASPEPPIEIRIAVLQRLAQFGWGELVPTMFEPFVGQLASLPQDRLPEPLVATLQALRRLDLQDTLARVAASFDPEAFPPRATYDTFGPAVCRYALAGALSFVGDARGTQLLGRGAALITPDTLTLSQLLGQIRIVAMAHAFTTIPFAIAGLERLYAYWERISDSFGTNTHFCLTVLDFVDAIALGLSEARVGRGAP